MSAPWAERWQRVAGWLRHRLQPRALILMYHRIVELPSDPHLLCVTPQHFAEHLDLLQKQTVPLRLEQLVTALRDGNVPRRAVVVTVDDGYADNLHNAKPLLERYDVSATVFVASGHVGHEREFWWDELDRLLLQPGTLPESLGLKIAGAQYEWRLDEAAQYGEEAARRHAAWSMALPTDPGPRQRLFRSLYWLIRPLPDGERRAVLDALFAWADMQPIARPTHRTLSAGELVLLAGSRLVDIGGHTVTHPALPSLPTDAQWEEIRRNKADLEEILNRRLTSFAYPHGLCSADTVDFVRDAGFACACLADEGPVRPASDLFQLPRVQVKDQDGDAFLQSLRLFLTT